MTDWTEAMVEERLRRFAAARRRLEAGHGLDTAGDHSMAEIAETKRWLTWLEPDDAVLVRVRSEGARWKLICWRFGISRATAYRRWRHGLGLIAWRLNGRPVAAGQSRRRFLEQMRAAEM
jgi:hypothetical protein